MIALYQMISDSFFGNNKVSGWLHKKHTLHHPFALLAMIVAFALENDMMGQRLKAMLF